MSTATLEKQTSNKVYVDILGEKYTIRGDADTGHIAEVARMVDTRMRDLKTQFRGISGYKLAVLTAINLADELLRERMDSGPVKEKTEEAIVEKTRQLITLLDEGLVGDILH